MNEAMRLSKNGSLVYFNRVSSSATSPIPSAQSAAKEALDLGTSSPFLECSLAAFVNMLTACSGTELVASFGGMAAPFDISLECSSVGKGVSKPSFAGFVGRCALTEPVLSPGVVTFWTISAFTLTFHAPGTIKSSV